ncbi:MAG TPA: hypothetical protein DGD08_10155 [Gemmatimonas aurantiaca]|nr:hypothetical protein [Gemmatimonas aurantiaca]
MMLLPKWIVREALRSLCLATGVTQKHCVTTTARMDTRKTETRRSLIRRHPKGPPRTNFLSNAGTMPTAIPHALLLSLTVVASSALLAPSALEGQPATCRTSLDSLDSKVRTNYAGHLLEVTGNRAQAHTNLLHSLRGRADTTPFRTCYPVLSAYTQWYADPHLFVFQSQSADTATAHDVQSRLRHMALTEEELRASIVRRRKVDAIEGIWYEGNLRLGVVPDPSGSPGAYVAVVLTADTVSWPVGTVRAEIQRMAPDRYRVKLWTRAFAEIDLLATLHRNDLLRLSPGIWGKAYPTDARRADMLDPVDAHRPTVVVRQRSVVVSIPSHDPQYTRRLDSLIGAHDEAIRSRPLLIVDLRGNEGGGAGTTRALNPYLASTTRKPTPYDSGTAVMLASPAQLAYARRIVGGDTSAAARRILQRLETETGSLVPLDGLPGSTGVEPSHAGNWRVAVMVDGGTVSAAEVLVLKALRSTRAVVIGEATAGALDYQSTQVISLGTGDRRWALGYPTITAHADLPLRGMRGKGIAPAVRVRWSSVADPITEMERRFAK